MLPIAFTSPFLLLAFAALPVLWILLRLVPPRPTRIDFPPLALLIGLAPADETPARTPWWLTLLRLLIAALVILALAGPIWHPLIAAATSEEPLLMVVDNGWASARDWDQRLAAIDERIAAAGASGRPIAILATADSPADISLGNAAQARDHLRVLKLQPWTPDRPAQLKPIGDFLHAHPSADLVWFSDGLALQQADPFVAGLKELLAGRRIDVVEDGARGPLALAGAENAPGAMTVRVLRLQDGAPDTGTVRALDLRGLPLGEATYRFDARGREAQARLDMPVDLRNDVARLEITGESSAGAVQLLDDRWRRRTIGIASGETAEAAQPLLSATYFLSRALEPFADIRSAESASPAASIQRFIDDRLPVIMLADVGNLAEAQDKLAAWVDAGGVLVRFAGPRLAASTDPLVPATLRQGGRTLDGALSWERPQALGPFAAGGALAGLSIPNDVTVSRQVLAEPDGDLPGKTWAQLADGTPLVTAAKRGKGLVVLFHVTADTTWSNLPLSGTFVDMLRRIVALSGATASAPAQASAVGAKPVNPPVVAPSRTLDGEGVLGLPPATAQPVLADQPGIGRLAHPAGFYGPPEGLVAVNTLAKDVTLHPIAYGPLAASISDYAVKKPVDLATPLILLALAILAADALIVFVMAGGARRLRWRAAVLALALPGALAFQPQDARAAETRPFEAALNTHLAYVVTGDKETDDTSLAGLKGLTAFLSQRTALEPGAPIGVDVNTDELAFDSLLYWPIVPGLDPPPPATMAKVDAFMKSGGMIVFDTRDALQQGAGFGSTPAGETLQRLLSSLDIPELEPVPRNHVLTKTFFLMETFPGRYDGGQTWVEASTVDDGTEHAAVTDDGVSPIIITSNDLAGAWAIGPDNQPMFPLTPGGDRQRELAFRAGVNIVMYALTGNYKADQVHVPALLERLGQ